MVCGTPKHAHTHLFVTGPAALTDSDLPAHVWGSFFSHPPVSAHMSVKGYFELQEHQCNTVPAMKEKEGSSASLPILHHSSMSSEEETKGSCSLRSTFLWILVSKQWRVVLCRCWPSLRAPTLTRDPLSVAWGRRFMCFRPRDTICTTSSRASSPPLTYLTGRVQPWWWEETDASSTGLLSKSLFRWQLPTGSVSAAVFCLCVHVTVKTTTCMPGSPSVHVVTFSGSAMEQWLAVMPHRKKVWSSIPGLNLRSFCIAFACSPHGSVAFLQVLLLSPTIQTTCSLCCLQALVK